MTVILHMHWSGDNGDNLDPNQAPYPNIKKPRWLKEEGRNINSAKVHD